MCAIAGIFDLTGSKPVDPVLLGKMRDVMAHRGPDAKGLWVSSDRAVGLANCRLAIVDLSGSANQPMCNEDGSVQVVFDGEIYNHAELRKELERLGHVFRSDHSDTETIVHGFEEWGMDCLKKFRGMFAFAVWDDAGKELYLARDRVGIKSLYYTVRDGRIVFSTEIKGLLADPSIPRVLDERAFYNYLTFLASPAPDTLLKGVKKISPGCFIKAGREGGVSETRYWELFGDKSDIGISGEEEAAEFLLEKLRETIRYHRISDVPVGGYLSGGIDSSAICTLLSEGRDNRLKTFTIGYGGSYERYANEFSYARKVSESTGTEYHEVAPTLDEVMDILPEAVYYMDEPISSTTIIPLYYLSRLARDNGVKVCLSGEGNDELFMGYPHVSRFLGARGLYDMPVFSPLKHAAMGWLEVTGRKKSFQYELLRRAFSGEKLFWGSYEIFTGEEKQGLLSSDVVAGLKGYSSYEAVRGMAERCKTVRPRSSYLDWMVFMDMNLRLPEYLLVRTDKMSMANSVETRVPFLDHEFIEAVMAIPEDIRIKGRQCKYIFKKAVTGILPGDIVERKKKQFPPPVKEWFRDRRLREYCRARISDLAGRANIVNMDRVDDLLDNGEAFKVWNLLILALWHERWIS